MDISQKSIRSSKGERGFIIIAWGNESTHSERKKEVFGVHSPRAPLYTPFLIPPLFLVEPAKRTLNKKRRESSSNLAEERKDTIQFSTVSNKNVDVL
jgi:hypothetical protein